METFYEINKQAAVHFHQKLFSNNAALKYVSKRGLSEESIINFGIGYADSSSDLYNHLKVHFNDEAIINSGLVKLENGNIKNMFFNRIMFPIMDGVKVVGFGARAIEDIKPKYLNSKESDYFQKNSILFGLNRLNGNSIILCEGYMDVIAYHQNGFKNAVATLGTAFTDNHAEIIKGLCLPVYLSYDNDIAGINASLKNGRMLLEKGIISKVIDLSPCKDPDEFLKNYSRESLQERIDNSKDYITFSLDLIAERRNFLLLVDFVNEYLPFIDNKHSFIEYICNRYGLEKGMF